VSYGFVGKQALLLFDPKCLSEKKNYDKFVQELNDISNSKVASEAPKHSLKNKTTWIKLGTSLMGPTGVLRMFMGASLLKDVFDDKELVRTQQLVYGITRLYLNEPEWFVNE
jgi:hypothetical protein